MALLITLSKCGDIDTAGVEVVGYKRKLTVALQCHKILNINVMKEI